MLLHDFLSGALRATSHSTVFNF